VAGFTHAIDYAGDGGPATQARLNNPAGVAVDGTGDVFIADTANNVIREVDAATGVITTVAGFTSTAGDSGDGGPATQALLRAPQSVAVDAKGNLFIVDTANNRVREVRAAGSLPSSGVIVTVAGGGAGCAWQTDAVGDGCAAAQARLAGPTSVAVDDAGNLFIADSDHNRIREVVAATGHIVTVAGVGTACPAGNVGCRAGGSKPATGTALGRPTGLALDDDGNLFFVDAPTPGQSAVREIVAHSDTVTTLVVGVCPRTRPAEVSQGDQAVDAPRATQVSSLLTCPTNITLDGMGSLFVANTGADIPGQGTRGDNVLEIITSTHTITSIVGSGARGFSGDGGPATQAELDAPLGVAMDAAGSLLVVDSANNRVRVIGGVSNVICTNAPMSPGVIPWHPRHTIRLADGLALQADLADGHLDLFAPALRLHARGPDLNLGQVWDSALAHFYSTSIVGQGWQSSLTPRMYGVFTGTVTFDDASGASWPFYYSGVLTATAPYTTYSVTPGLPWQLATSASITGVTTGYTLTNILDGEILTFDEHGNYSADTDNYGNSDTLAYSGTGPISEANSGGRTLRLSYGANSFLSEAASPLWQGGGSGAAGSQHVTYGYTGNNLTTITRGAATTDALTTMFGYNGTQLISVTTPYTQAVHTWVIGYDQQGRVNAITSPASGTIPAYTTQFTYFPELTQVVEGYGSPAPVTTTYELDAQGEATSVRDALGDTTSFAYDSDHDVTSRTDNNRHTTTYAYQYVGSYGSTGLVTETVRPPIRAYTTTNSLSPVVTDYYYDAMHELTGTVSPEGGMTLYGYGGHYGLITTTQTLAPIAGAGCGQSAAAALARVHVASGLVLSPASGACGSGGYRWRGRIVQRDPSGEVTGVVDGNGVDVSAAGVATLDSAAISHTATYTYTPAGDLAVANTPPIVTVQGGVTATAPTATTYGYDADGNRTATLSPNGNLTSYTYDHLGRLTETTLPPVTLWDGSTTAATETVGYDGDGNVAVTTDGAGDATRYSYDPLGRAVAVTNPVGAVTLVTYTATEPISARDALGRVTAYAYDAAGRRTGVSVPGVPTPGSTDPGSVTLSAGYDPVGNTAAITTPLDYATTMSRTVETRGYDALDEPVSDTVQGLLGGAGTSALTTLTTYDHDGNAIERVALGGDLTYNNYDLADRPLTSDLYASAAGAPGPSLAHASYTLDPADNLTDYYDFNGYDHHTVYDGANRPARTIDGLYNAAGLPAIATDTSYDPDGNLVALQRQDDASGGSSYAATYDAAGRLASADDGRGQTAYGYDAAGRLRTQGLPGGAGTITRGLDAEGRAITITVGAAGSAQAAAGVRVNAAVPSAEGTPTTVARRVPVGVRHARTSRPGQRLIQDPITGLRVYAPITYTAPDTVMGPVTMTIPTTATAPTTPTALDASNIQGTPLAFAHPSVNRPAAALAVTPTRMATRTPTKTATPAATATPAVTKTVTPTPTATRTPTRTATGSATRTTAPTAAPTKTVTRTPVPTTTNTPTSTPLPTATATSTSTPTATATNTSTRTPTSIPTSTATNTPTPTATSTPTGTNTPTATPASTPTATPTSSGGSDGSSIFGYYADDRPYTATLGAGTANLQELRTYYLDGRPLRLTVNGPGSVSTPLGLQEQDLHDPQGHTTTLDLILSNIPGSGAHRLAYTPLGQLTVDAGATRETWSYDADGNLGQRPSGYRGTGTAATYGYAYPAPSGAITPANWLPNELAWVTDTGTTNEYAYDNAGATTLITSTSGGTSSTIAFSYTAAGRVDTITLADGRQALLHYNARGLRDEFDLYPTDGGVLAETMGYDGGRVSQVSVMSSTAPGPGTSISYTESFVYRQDGTPLELLYQPAGGAARRYWYVVDARGSVVALTDDTGAVANYYTYDDWGAPDLLHTYEAVPQPLRYRGYWYDAWADTRARDVLNGGTDYASIGEAPWYWVGSRYYDPVLERYLQPDRTGGALDYSYAANDPADVCGAGAACPAGTVATAAGAGQLFPGVPYNPATFSVPENTTNALIANLALLGAGGLAEGASLRSPLADDSAGCYCFPARTRVVTPHGRRAIDALHVGDTVLAEDPHTHTLDAEPVRAVIVDGVKPLLAVDLSDGSAITVTANHPFYVDSGAAFAGPGWLPAGQLRAGDKLRTANGRDVTVTGLRQGVGRAMVYTLTVAHDHTFFAGDAQVLVHNAWCKRDLPIIHEGRVDPAPDDVALAPKSESYKKGDWGEQVGTQYLEERGYVRLDGGRYHGIDAVFRANPDARGFERIGDQDYLAVEFKVNDSKYNKSGQGSQAYIEGDLPKYFSAADPVTANEMAQQVTSGGFNSVGVRITVAGTLQVELIPPEGPYTYIPSK